MDSCKPDEKRLIIIKFNVCLVEELKYFFIIGNIIDIRKLNCIRYYELHLFTEIKIHVKIFILIFLYKNVNSDILEKNTRKIYILRIIIFLSEK